MDVCNAVPKEERDNLKGSGKDDNESINIEEADTTTTPNHGDVELDLPLPPPPTMHREWEVVGNREMSDEEYNLFVQRTTEHLLTYRRNEDIMYEDENEDENENEEEYDDEEHEMINPEFEEQEAEEDVRLYPLLAATVANDLPTVLLLLEEDEIDKNERSSLGRTALWYAAFYGHVEIQKVLVEHGCDMEKPDLNGRTPLFVACRAGHLAIVSHLLEQGANRDAVDADGWTSLHVASFRDHLDIAKLLMVYGANINLEYGVGIRALNLAASKEMDEAIWDEPRRRMEHGYKRSTEQSIDEEVEEVEISNQQPGGNGDEENVVEGEVADENQDSEPSDSEEADNN